MREMSVELGGETQAGDESLVSFIRQSGGKLAEKW